MKLSRFDFIEIQEVFQQLLGNLKNKILITNKF